MPTIAEYFAGIGLVRMGLESDVWKIVFANDFSNIKYELYKSFYADAQQYYQVKNIFDVDPDTVPQSTLATCSFPCVDLSLAGNMSGVVEGKHSSAFWGFINILRAQGKSSPPLVLVENVPGWLSSNNGENFQKTVRALNDLGYLCDVFSLDALRFLPQSRQRIFLIGTKFPQNKDIDRILLRNESLMTKRLKDTIRKFSTLGWTFFNIPAPPELKTSGLSCILENIDEDDTRWWPKEKVEYHLSLMSKKNKGFVDSLIESGQPSYRTFCRRMRNDEQRVEIRRHETCGCLRTAIGGSNVQFLIMAGKGRVAMRSLTIREYARLQGVPDAFPITGNITAARNGFGDATCVPVIRWISENVLPLAIQNIPSDLL